MEEYACVHVEHVLTDIGPACKSIREGRKSAYKYLGSPIPYYGNSSACFQVSLVLCGDISPNPGPLPPACDTHDEVTVHRYDSTDLHRYGNMVSGQNKRYGMRLHHDVWNHIHHLGIARRRKTHRGSKGRGRAKSARDHFEGSQAIEVRITCQQSSNCALLSKLLKQYHVQPVPEAGHIRPNHAVKFVLWNARSLKARGKATAFCDFVISEKISIGAVTETWLTDSLAKMTIRSQASGLLFLTSPFITCLELGQLEEVWACLHIKASVSP